MSGPPSYPVHVPFEIARLICAEVAPNSNLWERPDSIQDLRNIRFLAREFSTAAAEKLFRRKRFGFGGGADRFAQDLRQLEGFCSTGVVRHVEYLQLAVALGNCSERTKLDHHLPGFRTCMQSFSRLTSIEIATSDTWESIPFVWRGFRDLLNDFMPQLHGINIDADVPTQLTVASMLQGFVSTPNLYQLCFFFKKASRQWRQNQRAIATATATNKTASHRLQHASDFAPKLPASVDSLYLMTGRRRRSFKPAPTLILKHATQCAISRLFIQRIRFESSALSDFILHANGCLNSVEFIEVGLDGNEWTNTLDALSQCSSLHSLKLRGHIKPSVTSLPPLKGNLGKLLLQQLSIPTQVVAWLVGNNTGSLTHVHLYHTHGSGEKEWATTLSLLLGCPMLNSLFISDLEVYKSDGGALWEAEGLIDQAKKGPMRNNKALDPRSNPNLRRTVIRTGDCKTFCLLGELVRMVRARRKNWMCCERLVMIPFGQYFTSLHPWASVESGEATEDDIYEWNTDDNAQHQTWKDDIGAYALSIYEQYRTT